MPFTLAHPLAAIPMRRLGLPLDALVIGAMIPDLVLFMPLGLPYGATHSALALVTWDLLLGLAALAGWRLVLRAPLIDASPDWVRERLPRVSDLSPDRRVDHGISEADTSGPDVARPRRSGTGTDSLRALMTSALAVVLGAATHLLWDAFTHESGWMVERIALLRMHVAGLGVYGWLQYASGILGVLILAGWGMRALGRGLPRERPRQVPWAPWAVIIAPAVLAALTAGLVLGALWHRVPIEGLAFAMVTRSMALGGAAACLGCAAWWILPAIIGDGRRRRPS